MFKMYVTHTLEKERAGLGYGESQMLDFGDAL